MDSVREYGIERVVWNFYWYGQGRPHRQQRFEGSEQLSPVAVWRQYILGRGNSQCKGPKIR